MRCNEQIPEWFGFAIKLASTNHLTSSIILILVQADAMAGCEHVLKRYDKDLLKQASSWDCFFLSCLCLTFCMWVWLKMYTIQFHPVVNHHVPNDINKQKTHNLLGIYPFSSIFIFTYILCVCFFSRFLRTSLRLSRGIKPVLHQVLSIPKSGRGSDLDFDRLLCGRKMANETWLVPQGPPFGDGVCTCLYHRAPSISGEIWWTWNMVYWIYVCW